MNREFKRNLRKDKNLIKNIFEIIYKYLPELIPRLSKLTDKRHKSYTTYSMKVICVTRLLGLLCGITELVTMSDKFNKDGIIKNISSLCNEKLKEIPYWETIQDVFIDMQIDELRDIQKYIVKALIRSKMFDKYRYDGAFQIIFDGTGLSNHDYNLNGNCLTRKSKDGKISYYKYVLECKLCVGSMVFSLDSEFIENQSMFTENEKQDCETKAFKRMIKRIRKNYPKQKFLVSGDGLYATDPIISIIEDYQWKYIFNLKPERLKYINECFEGNIILENETSHKHFYLSTNIEYKKHTIHAFKFIENEGTSLETTFRYISNIIVNNDNIKELIKLGRTRWQIEECFYTQKHRTFNISHMCSRNDNAMKCHYFFIQFAHAIRQLFEFGHSAFKEMKLKLKEVSSFLLEALTSTSSSLNELEINFQLRFDD